MSHTRLFQRDEIGLGGGELVFQGVDLRRVLKVGRVGRDQTLRSRLCILALDTTFNECL